MIWSALGASARRLMIKSRKRCYRRWVYRPGWGRRAGSTQRTGRRGATVWEVLVPAVGMENGMENVWGKGRRWGWDTCQVRTGS